MNVAEGNLRNSRAYTKSDGIVGRGISEASGKSAAREARSHYSKLVS